MFKIRKRIRFEMAHRLVQSWSQKCQQLHGHSYVCDVVLAGKTLNQDGMILDFGALKESLVIIDAMFDHKVVLCKKDPLTSQFCANEMTVVAYNPTAELMAQDIALHLMTKFYQLDNIECVCVRLHETASGWAEYSITRQQFEELNKEKEQ